MSGGAIALGHPIGASGKLTDVIKSFAILIWLLWKCLFILFFRLSHFSDFDSRSGTVEFEERSGLFVHWGRYGSGHVRGASLKN